MVAALFISLFVIAVVMSAPFETRKPVWIAIALPVLFLITYLAYQKAFDIECPPETVPIRLDLFLLYPLCWYAGAVSLLRLAFALLKRKDGHHKSRFMAACVIFAILIIITFKTFLSV
jgi:hypothetical protein